MDIEQQASEAPPQVSMTIALTIVNCKLEDTVVATN